MSFLARAGTGFAMIAVSVTALGFGAWRMNNASGDSAGGPPQRGGNTPTVELIQLEPTRVSPTLTAQGRVQASQQFRINFPIAGRLEDVSTQLTTGLRVRKGDELARLNATPFEDALRRAELDLAAADNQLKESRQRQRLADQELAAAQEQTGLRQGQLARIEQLIERGLASTAEREAAALALSGARQTELTRAGARINASASTDRAELDVKRAQLVLAQATRDLADTVVRAPFNGVLEGVTAKVGDRINAGQTLGTLTDLSQLEVSFSTQNPRVVRLMQTDAQAPLPLETTVNLTIGSINYQQTGVLNRVAATGDLASGGRQLFARLNPDPASLLRPGDWVSVSVREPVRDDIAWIPLSALSDDDQVFNVQDGRLRAQPTVVLQRDERRALIELPPNRAIAATLAPRFSDGLPVQVATSEPQADPSIDELIAFVESNTRMPKDRKADILNQLRDDPPPALVTRLTERLRQQ
ncbi:efflux RND transporter periplasmic adaptor subunit [Litorivicinus lipolyticus]|nr:HlyD family efflux transporter periplasmic adaptor subunit [Litorivicinus lipolyticus]